MGYLREAPNDWEPLRLTAEDGKPLPEVQLPSAETALEIFRWMVFGRIFDQRMLSLQRQGRIGTIGSIRGQEASAAGLGLALRQEDWLAGSYRELLSYLVHGVPAQTLITLYRGGVPGPFPAGVRALPVQIVIGAQMPQAAGLGLALKLREEPAAVVACCGDGATSEGDFHEGVNFAGAHGLPVVFFVQNNGWAISVPRARQTASATIAQKGFAYGMPAALVDGNDPLAVYEVCREALERARAGGGPSLVEAVTYRLGPHTTSDDPTRYRLDSEVASHEERDPLPRMRRCLEAAGIYPDGLQEQLEEEARKALGQAIAAAEAEPPVTPEQVFDLTWAQETPQARRDRERSIAELREVGEL